VLAGLSVDSVVFKYHPKIQIIELKYCNQSYLILIRWLDSQYSVENTLT